MIDLSVNVGGLTLKNPVMPASGTFAEELSQLIDFNLLGALVTKTITAEKRPGNPLPRVCELSSGMMNAIGIPSKGIDAFIQKTLPFYQRFGSPLIVSISAPTAQEFAAIAARLSSTGGVAGIEANISCPNIEAHGQSFAMHADSTARVVKAIRATTSLPLWVKLTPNSGEVVDVAKAAETEGADAIVMGNTLLGLSIDVRARRPRLGNVMGGISGEAIRPLMVRLTYQCAQALSIPIVGCGGVTTAEDAVEYLLAGASAVQVGTATFIHPKAMQHVIQGLVAFCQQEGVASVRSLTGGLNDAPGTLFGATP